MRNANQLITQKLTIEMHRSLVANSQAAWKLEKLTIELLTSYKSFTIEFQGNLKSLQSSCKEA
jgi:hypothetical protein